MQKFIHPSWMVIFFSAIIIVVDIVLAVSGIIKNDSLETEVIFEGASEWFGERVSDAVADEELAGLGKGYLLGSKDSIISSMNDKIRIVGLSHIVVVSGTHLGIIIGFAKKVFGRISRLSGIYFSVLLLMLYIGIIGLTPSLVRAGLVAILSLVAWYFGKEFEPWRIIIIVAALSLLYEPRFIINVSWQLSMMAYAGIIVILPILLKIFYAPDEKPGFIASTLIASIAAMLSCLPISLFYFGSFSIVSFIANILILPTIPYAMGATFIAGITGFGWPAQMILKFHVYIINILSEHEEFMVTIEKGNPAVFLLYVPVVIMIIVAKLVYIRGCRDRLRRCLLP
ncbi:MAG: ComEC/Rec2 family competence protein [Candidatus Saccharibacteria bacterium]|nr:ComEC/Rec2 family competence protein [Candidatus Saccharibacteria bacterium]